MRKDRGFTLIELAFVICIFAVTVLVLTPVVRLTKERAERINCANNLRLLSLGLHMYASDHNGEFPPDLGVLYPDYVKSDKTFGCPAKRSAGTPEKADYIYVPGLKETSAQDEVITCDADGNHGVRGKNVLKVDGSVEWAGRNSGRTIKIAAR
jgi:prepilin-type N-terminal cleavage/methylation domain-containing protein